LALGVFRPRESVKEAFGDDDDDDDDDDDVDVGLIMWRPPTH